MLFRVAAVVASAITTTLAVQNPHRHAPAKPHWGPPSYGPPSYGPGGSHNSPCRGPQSFNSSKTESFVVDGTAIPEVDFDIGESYAGTLSIDSNSTNENQLWFWFFPSDNPAACDEIVIWLNGGPGCSSLDGLFQENGPFLWQSGTYSPIQNPYSWTNLTNMVWIDQPIGTGFSPAAPGAPAKIKNEIDVSTDFAGFWKNFMETFDLQGRKVYFTGESYAGQYIPYMADYMLDQNDTEYYNVQGIQINDPSIGDDAVLIYAPAVTHMNDYAPVFALNDSFVEDVNARAEKCGYFAFMEEALTYPPAGKFTAPNISAYDGDCYVWDDIIVAEIFVNPCFNIYHLTDYCPFLWDELGFPSLGFGPNNYFNRSDVQKAINAPPTSYAICGDDTLGLEHSPPSSFGPLPRVVEATNNVIVGSGWLDYLLLTNGTLATLNNMTWNGAQGFSTDPVAGDRLMIPIMGLEQTIEETEYQGSIPSVPVGIVSGGGIMGTTHTERGLTFTTVFLAGHEIPQYVPSASYRQLEFLLGRIDSLSSL